MHGSCYLFILSFSDRSSIHTTAESLQSLSSSTSSLNTSTAAHGICQKMRRCFFYYHSDWRHRFWKRHWQCWMFHFGWGQRAYHPTGLCPSFSSISSRKEYSSLGSVGIRNHCDAVSRPSPNVILCGWRDVRYRPHVSRNMKCFFHHCLLEKNAGISSDIENSETTGP